MQFTKTLILNSYYIRLGCREGYKKLRRADIMYTNKHNTHAHIDSNRDICENELYVAIMTLV